VVNTVGECNRDVRIDTKPIVAEDRAVISGRARRRPDASPNRSRRAEAAGADRGFAHRRLTDAGAFHDKV
jgi:hypothetical protein